MFCLGVGIYFFVPAGVFINKNIRMAALKAQSQGIDGILARTGEKNKFP